MYALSFSAEGDYYWCVPPDPGIADAALGASASGTPPGTAPAEALHTFTLDSGASRCFFRDSTTLTPLPSHVLVRLADPSGVPVFASSSTVLPFPAVPSGSLSGLHLPSFSTNLVSTAALQDAMVTTTTLGGQRVSICTCTRTGRHLATFTRRPGSSLYTLATEPPQVAASAQVSAPGQVAASCSSRLLSHQILLWHHCLSHPSLPRLRGMHSHLLVSGLPRSLPPLPPSLAPPCLPCVEGRQRAAPHSSSFPPTTAPLQTLHMDVWGPARVSGQGRERYFPLVVDDYTRYTTVLTFLSCVCTLTEVRSAPSPPSPLFLAPGPPPVDPLPPQGPAPSGVSQVDPLLGTAPVQVAVVSGAAPSAASGGATSGGAEPGGAGSEGAGSGGAEPEGSEPGGAESEGAEPRGAESEGAESGGAEPRGAALSGGPAGASPRLSSQQLREWLVQCPHRRSGAPVAREPGDAGAGGAAVTTRAGDPTEPGAAGAGGAGAGVAGVGGPGAGGAGAAGARAVDPGAGGAGGTVRPRPYFVPLLQQVLGVPSSTGLPPPFLCPLPDQSQPPLQPASPLPVPSPYTERSGGLTERREPASLHVPVPALLESPLPKANQARAANPTVARLLATADIDPSFESAAASALVAELLDFAAACRLDYASALVAKSVSASPPSVGGESALRTDVLEDWQEDFECLAAAVPRFTSLLLAPEGDPDAPDIPTPRSYAEAITGPYSSQWQAAMDAEMASWKSTGTYVDEVPPPGVNIVDGMWIFRVKRPPGSPPAFKARYVARGFSQRQGVDYFQTFSPTPKMTTLRVLLHVAAQRDYELHSLDFSTAFLQGSLQEEIWLRRPPGFTGSFPTGTQWSLCRPVYGLRQAPREWHDTLRTTLAALGFVPSTADPSLFLRTDTSLPPFYVLVYVDDLVLATADTEALTLVKSELQKRHTCTDLGELRSYLGLQITRDRARRTITLTQSHMVHQVLQRFGFQYSSPQLPPLSTSHSLSAPPSDESVEPSGPYPELVGCLITSSMGLLLGGRGPVVLTGHADASWVDDSATQRSSQGYTFSLGSGSISWRSTRSSSVLSSSCEAEIYAGAMAAQELRWLTYLLTDLGEQPRSPPVLYIDNKAMIAFVLCFSPSLDWSCDHCLFWLSTTSPMGRTHARLGAEIGVADVQPSSSISGDVANHHWPFDSQSPEPDLSARSGGKGAASTTGAGRDSAESIAEWRRRSAEAGAHFFPLQRAEDAPSRDELHRRILGGVGGGLKGKGKSQRAAKATEYLPVLQYDSTLLSTANGTLGNTMVNYSTYLDDTIRLPVYPYYVALKLGSQKQEFSMALNVQLRHIFVPCDCLHCGTSRKGTPDSKPFSTLSSTTLQFLRRPTLPGGQAYDYYEADTVADSFLESAGHVVEDTVYLTAPDGTEAHRSIIFGCGVNQLGYWGMQGRSSGAWTAGGVLGLAQGSPFLEQLTAVTNSFAVCLDKPTPTSKTTWDGKMQQHTGSSHLTIGAAGLPAGASYSTLSYPTGLPYSHITLTTATRVLNITDDPANINLNKTSYMPADASEDDIPGFFFLPESFVHLIRLPLFISLWSAKQEQGGGSDQGLPVPLSRRQQRHLPLLSLASRVPRPEPGLFNKYLFFNYTNNTVGWLQAPQCGAEPILPPPPPSPPPSGGTPSKGATHSLSLLAAAVVVITTSTALLALALL
ncbi:unnamed protein product [Closterium sp. NIES-53]